MTVVDVNTGKFVGSGGNLEETVTKNNLEAAEEIVRQLRLRDIGGIIVVDFIDMVLESNRDLVLRRLVECLSRDRTKHQVAEVTSLGLVQMTRKKLGLGLLETFSEPCEVCAGRGVVVHHDPVVRHRAPLDRQSPACGPSSARRRAPAPTGASERHARDHRGREVGARADRGIHDPPSRRARSMVRRDRPGDRRRSSGPRSRARSAAEPAPKPEDRGGSAARLRAERTARAEGSRAGAFASPREHGGAHRHAGRAHAQRRLTVAAEPSASRLGRSLAVTRSPDAMSRRTSSWPSTCSRSGGDRAGRCASSGTS